MAAHRPGPRPWVSSRLRETLPTISCRRGCNYLPFVGGKPRPREVRLVTDAGEQAPRPATKLSDMSSGARMTGHTAAGSGAASQPGPWPSLSHASACVHLGSALPSPALTEAPGPPQGGPPRAVLGVGPHNPASGSGGPTWGKHATWSNSASGLPEGCFQSQNMLKTTRVSAVCSGPGPHGTGSFSSTRTSQFSHQRNGSFQWKLGASRQVS